MDKLGHAIHTFFYIKPKDSLIREQFLTQLAEFESKLVERPGPEDQEHPQPPLRPADVPDNWKSFQNVAWQSAKEAPIRQTYFKIVEFVNEEALPDPKEVDESKDTLKNRRGKVREDRKKARVDRRKAPAEEKKEVRKEPPKEEVKAPPKAVPPKAPEPPKAAAQRGKGREDKKVEEIKQEPVDEGPPPDPTLEQKFLAELHAKMLEFGDNFVQYLNFRDTAVITPLMPVPYLPIKVPTPPPQDEPPQPPQPPQPIKPVDQFVQNPPPLGLASKDDEDREFDFRYFNRLLCDVGEDIITPEYFLQCANKQIQRGCAAATDEEIQNLHQFFDEKLQTITGQGVKDFQTQESIRYQETLTIDECNLPQIAAKNATFPEIKTPIRDSIQDLIKNLVVPGQNRHMMPQVALKSEALRNAERPKLYPFSSLPIPELERLLILSEFEKVLFENFPYLQWDLSDRNYEERFTHESLAQTLFNALVLDADIITHYYARNDALLLTLCHKTPPGRVSRRQWTGDWRIFPSFWQWMEYLKGQTGNIYWDVDELKVGRIHEKTKTLYPADDSLIRITQYFTGPRVLDDQYRKELKTPRSRNMVVKDDYIFGVRENGNGGEFWCRLPEGKLMLVENEKDGASTTISFKNGLTVKWLYSGDVLQQMSESLKDERLDIIKSHVNKDILKDVQEVNRVITGMGTVIRYMEDGSKELLFANGNFSYMKEGKWITTNNRGMRQQKDVETGEIVEIERIPSATITDPHNSAKTMTREDQVTCIKYSDGSCITIHREGTKMHTNPDGSQVIVESPFFAPIRISKGEAQDLLEIEQEFSQKASDGKLFQVFLPDGGRMSSITQQTSCSLHINLLTMKDGRILKTDSTGEVVLGSLKPDLEMEESIKLVPSKSVPPRAGDLNESLEIEQHNKTPSDTEVKYPLPTPTEIKQLTAEQIQKLNKRFYNQLFTEPDQRESGVYSCYPNRIFTKDCLDTYYEVQLDGKVIQRTPQHALKGFEPESPKFEGNEYVQEGIEWQGDIIPPRLFVIYNTGEGSELLSASQLSKYFADFSPDKQQQLDENQAFTWLRPQNRTLIEQGHIDNSPLLNYEMPKVLKEIQKEHYTAKPSPPLYYLYRNLKQHAIFTPQQRNAFAQDLQAFNDWEQLRTTQRFELGVEDLRDEADKNHEFNLQRQVLELRKDKNLTLIPNHEEYKRNVLDYKPTPDEDSDAAADEEQDEVGEVLRDPSLIPQADVKAVIPVQQPTELDTFKSSIKSSTNIRSFLNYFDTVEGQEFLLKNPPAKRESPKVEQIGMVNTEEMPQEELNAYEAMRESLTQQGFAGSSEMQPFEKTDNPLIALEPEARGKDKYRVRPVILKPFNKVSCFTEVEQLQLLREEAEFAASMEYLEKKTSNYDVYGIPRQAKPSVNSVRNTEANRIPNEKFILTESATDRRVRTSSMANRLHAKAPTVAAMRKEGIHTILSRALFKKQSYNDMIGTQNMMISSYTADPFKRNLMVTPVSARFGLVKSGEIYNLKITIKNEDVDLQRFSVRQPTHPDVKVIYKPTSLASGISTSLLVELLAREPGRVDSEFQIATKAEIYKIAVMANIVNEEEFRRVDEESRRLHGRTALKPNVIMKGQRVETITQAEWENTTTSDINLPRIPSGLNMPQNVRG